MKAHHLPVKVVASIHCKLNGKLPIQRIEMYYMIRLKSGAHRSAYASRGDDGKTGIVSAHMRDRIPY